jgi:hypothetical protein
MCLNKHFLYCIIKKYNYFCKRSKENIVKIFSGRRQHWLFAASEPVIIFLILYIICFTKSLNTNHQ